MWLQGNRVVPESQGRTSTRLYYSADEVLVAGANVVHRGQQRFFPAAEPRHQLRLLLFAVRVTVRDACSASRSAPPSACSTPTAASDGWHSARAPS